MLTKRWDKSRLPSRHVTEGPGRAPHRSYYYAMGLTEEEINQPFVGVATCWNEAAPCNIALSRQAQSVKRGVAEAGGTPREFTTITVTDGIAMGHQGMKASLVSREVIADSVELTVRGHCYDALVGLAGCDKSLPGMMMAMLRLNVPSVFMYGGSILPGSFHGRDVTVVDVFEAVGQHAAGRMSDAELHELECVACPSAGACGGQFTANTMAMVSEAIGLALPGSAGSPAPYEDRDRWAAESGRAVMSLLESGLRPRDIVTREALENAAVVVGATGGSTNAGLHLPAMAHEAGIRFTMDDVVEIMRRTPYIADLKPGGKYVALDVHKIGGVPVVLKALLDGGLLHGDCMTVSGRTLAENLKDVVFPEDQDVVYPVSRAISRTGGVVGLRGNLAPDGAIVKIAGLHSLQFEGTALCFDSEEEAFAAVDARAYKAGRRHRGALRGAEGRAGDARDALHHLGDLRPGHGRAGRPDHGWPLQRRDPRLLRRPCRAGGGGRRPDRAAPQRRPDPARCRERHDRRAAAGQRTGRPPRRLDPARDRLQQRRDLEICPDSRPRPSRRGYPPRCRGRDALLREHLTGSGRAVIASTARSTPIPNPPRRRGGWAMLDGKH